MNIEKVKEEIKEKIKEIYFKLPPVLRLRFSHKIIRKIKEDEELKKQILKDFMENLGKVESMEEKIRNLLFMLSVLENKKQKIEGVENIIE